MEQTYYMFPFSQNNFTSFFKMSSPCPYPFPRKEISLHIFLNITDLETCYLSLNLPRVIIIWSSATNCTLLFSFNGPRKRLQKHMSPFINRTLIHNFSFASKIRCQNWEQKMFINRIVTTDLPHKDKTRSQLPPDKRAGQIRILNTLKELHNW